MCDIILLSIPGETTSKNIKGLCLKLMLRTQPFSYSTLMKIRHGLSPLLLIQIQAYS